MRAQAEIAPSERSRNSPRKFAEAALHTVMKADDEELAPSVGAPAARGSALYEHATKRPEWYLLLVCASLCVCAAYCLGCMLVYLAPILEPLIFSIFLMYLLSPVVQLLTTPFRVRPRRLLAAVSRRRRRDDEEELQSLMPDVDELAVGATCAKASGGAVILACPQWLAIVFVVAILFALLWMLCSAFASGCTSLQARLPPRERRHAPALTAPPPFARRPNFPRTATSCSVCSRRSPAGSSSSSRARRTCCSPASRNGSVSGLYT